MTRVPSSEALGYGVAHRSREVFGALRSAFRWKFGGGWYSALYDAAAGGPVDCVLIGTSRVAESMDAALFAEEMQRYDKPSRTVNLGIGYMTMTLHEMGLRNAFHEEPLSMRGCTVFIEAPGGIALEDFRLFHPERPAMWLGVSRPRDLQRLWRCEAPLATRGLLAATQLAGHFAPSGARGPGSLATEALEASRRARESVVDYADVAGIMADAGLIARARRSAGEVSDEELRTLCPLGSWDEHPVRRIVDMAREHGGRVVFFEMPLSTTFGRVFETPTRQSDRETFRARAREWNTPVLSPSFAWTDEDFPDLWHMRRSRTAEFTRAVAAAFARHP